MPYLKVGTENSADIKIHYNDHGVGSPVVLIHGYPFSGAAWEKQEPALIAAGYRVIAYDRRGFGLSSQPSTGYSYDTFADDLQQLLVSLDLRDVTLIGHSMGTGEIARYLANFGDERIARAVFVSPIPPFLLNTEENPDGVPMEVFEKMKADVVADRPAFLTGFIHKFYNDTMFTSNLSEAKGRADFNVGVSASPIASLACISTWLTDFRRDLPRIRVPSLVIQGNADKILPIKVTGEKLAEELGCEFVRIEGGSHGICWTHPDEVNSAILAFFEADRAQVGKRNHDFSDPTLSENL